MKKYAFTLIEVLAAMAILSIIVLAMSTLFGQATDAWLRGESEVIAYDFGRSAIEEIYKDLVTSVGDDILPFAQSESFTADTLAGRCDAVYMFSCTTPRFSDADKDRDFSEVNYFVIFDSEGRGELLRRRFSMAENTFDVRDYLPGGSRDSHNEIFSQAFFQIMESDDDDETDIIMQNVYSFEVDCYPEGQTNPETDYYSKAQPGFLPARVRTRIRVLSDEEWARAEIMNNQGRWHSYAQANAKVFEAIATMPTRSR